MLVKKFRTNGKRYGLANLAYVRGEKKKKKDVLLIREYDSIINNALIEIEGNSQLRGIVSLNIRHTNAVIL